MSASGQGNGNGRREDPEIGWRDRVVFSRAGFAYRPGDVVTTGGDEAKAIAAETWPEESVVIEVAEEVGPCARLTGVPDPLRLIQDLRLQGIVARPNHVFFIHCGFCGPHPASSGFGVFGINPASINPASINPASINPASINPAAFNPASINPASINPASINPASINPASINPASINPNHPYRVTGLRRSSARPAAPTKDEVAVLTTKISCQGVEGGPKVIVLDTGLAGTNPPATLSAATAIHAAAGADVDEPDNDRNNFIDPAAGHGTFIAGLVNQVAPGCTVTVDRVATMYGDTDEFTAARLVDGLDCDDRTILSLSFGGQAMDDEAVVLGWAIRRFQARGGVVVASAGNDSSCLPSFPAAFPDVVSVGAIGPSGPAPFTNYGPWVRACAPGVDLTSMFFDGFSGQQAPGPDGVDPDDFKGWARWSGTSFSAPVVVGALARMMMWSGCSAKDAVKRVVDAPELMRIPNLGTVVNVI
ncbi:MAG: hypothetical protein QOI56_1445 [Actinomycetota bacterium]|jgi:hypothetical protein|nr:hypothetical protein [Actinomycetota bacterium]MEA2932660.1 hypothetical protein [Actinomycetota bacterium]